MSSPEDSRRRPLLIWDGECGYCGRWVRRWRQLTGERVRYATLQQEPPPDGVDEEALRRAVHLTLPDGRVVRGAQAIAELGTFMDATPVFRTAYRWLPGFGWLADRAYALAARWRGPMDRLTRLFAGRDLRRPRYALTRWLFMRLLGLVLLCAFLSWWVQLDGLVGAQGIIPAVEELQHRDAQRPGSTILGMVSSDADLHVCNALGTLAALLLLLNLAPGIALVTAWLCYQVLSATGGVFMGYQWDALLLETCAAALLLVPWTPRPGLAASRRTSFAGVMVLRVLIFKLMFLSAWTKMASGDASWADGTALSYHYWTQPLPAWTSFFAHHAEALHQFGVWFMYAAELVAPFLLFLPPRRFRYLAFWLMAPLMVLIALTGNYGYFNLLTLALLVVCLDDGAIRRCVPRRWRDRVPDTHTFEQRSAAMAWRVPAGIVAVALVALSLAHTWRTVDRDEPLPGLVRDALAAVAPIKLSSSYGLFRVMTKQRPEITVEGSHDGQLWREYRFAWKPARLDDAPNFAQPHMPRLDWQMWFAALRGDCRRSAWGWYPRFVRRLLEGSPAVSGLLDDDPFADAPPRYIRSTLYHYRFADWDDWAKRGVWWQRTHIGPYCPTLTLVDGELRVAKP